MCILIGHPHAALRGFFAFAQAWRPSLALLITHDARGTARTRRQVAGSPPLPTLGGSALLTLRPQGGKMAAAAAVARGASGRGGCAGGCARPRRCAARASHVYHYAELAVDTGVAGDMSALPRQEVSIHDLTAPLRKTVSCVRGRAGDAMAPCARPRVF